MTSQSPQYVTPVMSYDSSLTGTSEIYNSQVFRFDSCSRAIFGGKRLIFQMKSQQEGCYSGCV